MLPNSHALGACKKVVKALCSHQQHGQDNHNRLETVMHCILQILWRLLHVRPGVSVVGPRVQEIFTVCLQQRQQWPQVFNFLIKGVPGKVAEQLKSLNAEQHGSTRAGTALPMAPVWAGVNKADKMLLAAYQNKRHCAKQQALVKHTACMGVLPNNDAQQKAHKMQAEARDAADLKAILLVRLDNFNCKSNGQLSFSLANLLCCLCIPTPEHASQYMHLNVSKRLKGQGRCGTCFLHEITYRHIHLLSFHFVS